MTNKYCPRVTHQDGFMAKRVRDGSYVILRWACQGAQQEEQRYTHSTSTKKPGTSLKKKKWTSAQRSHTCKTRRALCKNNWINKQKGRVKAMPLVRRAVLL